MKIHELYSDPSKWTKYRSARDINGNPVELEEISAYSFCLSAALEVCYDSGYDRAVARDKIKKYLKIDFIAVWNDRYDRTFQDVKDLVTKLDI